MGSSSVPQSAATRLGDDCRETRNSPYTGYCPQRATLGSLIECEN